MAAEIFSIFYQFADVFAFLVLSAAGLAIIFGMMGDVVEYGHWKFGVRQESLIFGGGSLGGKQGG